MCACDVTRNEIEKPTAHRIFSGRLWAATLALTVAAIGCTDQTAPEARTTGSLALDLILADGFGIDEVRWTIRGGDMEPMSGAIDTSAPGATASIEVYGLPEGDGYAVELVAASVDGQLTCEGSTTFDVTAGQVTEAHVMLNCQKPGTLGGVRADGKLNVCPYLTKVVVSPLETSEGEGIDLFATAADEEGDPITFEWTANNGSIANPAGASTTYFCTEVGEDTITVTVTDDNGVFCDSATWTVPVTCVEGEPVLGAPEEDRTRRFTITELSDCDQIRDYPYARNLFCPATFTAVQTVRSTIAESLGARPSDGYFYYYQTLADPLDPPGEESQTTVACLATEAPWGSEEVVGAGTPLCELVAYVTSVGQRPDGDPDERGNPVPATLRDFPTYFSGLYPPSTEALLDEFLIGGTYGPLIDNLGALTFNGFVNAYPPYAPNALYAPGDWGMDTQYFGISGGGGGGWGGELGFDLPTGDSTLVSFGGGGGGGMTSQLLNGVASTALGGGGGGGMQLSSDYSNNGISYNGLGLGGGTSSDRPFVQYSYNDYEGSGRPAVPVHIYNPDVIDDYTEQMDNMVAQLVDGVTNGQTVVFRGGGGMGAGTEYLMANGEEYVPHALSTQAGFSFRYEFKEPADGEPVEDSDDECIYAQIGDFYNQANQQALADCGNDYSNYSCICPIQQAIVVSLTADFLDSEGLGDVEVPAWLGQQHCPSTNEEDTAPNQPVDGVTNYQQLLLDSLPDTTDEEQRNLVRQFFESLNQ
ncbi:MAG: hypothetical protein AAF500_14760 [Myxococcota bacterium]